MYPGAVNGSTIDEGLSAIPTILYFFVSLTINSSSRIYGSNCVNRVSSFNLTPISKVISSPTFKLTRPLVFK